MSNTSNNQEDSLKNSEINDMFNIWLDIAGPGDKQTLKQNEVSIKKDLFDKLTQNELTSLKQYSSAIKDILSVKNKPFDPLFLTSLSYLTSNFNSAKQIIAKTSASNLLPNFILGPVPQSNYTNNTI